MTKRYQKLPTHLERETGEKQTVKEALEDMINLPIIVILVFYSFYTWVFFHYITPVITEVDRTNFLSPLIYGLLGFVMTYLFFQIDNYFWLNESKKVEVNIKLKEVLIFNTIFHGENSKIKEEVITYLEWTKKENLMIDTDIGIMAFSNKERIDKEKENYFDPIIKAIENKEDVTVVYYRKLRTFVPLYLKVGNHKYENIILELCQDRISALSNEDIVKEESQTDRFGNITYTYDFTPKVDAKLNKDIKNKLPMTLELKRKIGDIHSNSYFKKELISYENIDLLSESKEKQRSYPYRLMYPLGEKPSILLRWSKSFVSQIIFPINLISYVVIFFALLRPVFNFAKAPVLQRVMTKKEMFDYLNQVREHSSMTESLKLGVFYTIIIALISVYAVYAAKKLNEEELQRNKNILEN